MATALDGEFATGDSEGQDSERYELRGVGSKTTGRFCLDLLERPVVLLVVVYGRVRQGSDIRESPF